MKQVVFVVCVDPQLSAHWRGEVRSIPQPWPLDERITQIYETHQTEKEALDRMLELSREGKEIYLEPYPDHFREYNENQ